MGWDSGSNYEEEEEEEEEEQEEEEEEKQETSEVSGARKKGDAASEEEEENSIGTNSCRSSQGETNGKRLKAVSSEGEESEDERSLCWLPNALTSIKAVDAHMIRRRAWISHTSPKSCLPDLKRVRQAATRLVKHTDAAISLIKDQQSLLDKKDLKAQISALQKELAHRVEQSQAESRKQALLLLEARSAQQKQSTLFQKEKESLKHSHMVEKEALIVKHKVEQRDLRRQLEEEKDKSICCVCHEKPRDTIILPCLHFQYCFSCLLRHRDANSNTCPTCRGPIQGLNMSSYLSA